MGLNLLEKSILATIVYYDIMNYPLTGFEVFKYLINPSFVTLISKMGQDEEIEPIGEIKLLNVLKTLTSNSLRNFIKEEKGFYSLKESLYQTRIERQKISDEMWKKARRIVKWLQIIPYTRMVLVSGSMAMYNAAEKSDIDLLIVVKSGRIWIARLLTTLFFQIIGQRRHGRKIKNRFCLNHYITDKFLQSSFSDLYTAQLYAHLVPVLELENGLYHRFQFENKWIGNYLFFYDIEKLDNQRKIKNNLVMKFIRNCQEIILNTFLGKILEKILGFFQKKHIKRHPLINQKDGRIVFDDKQLEFHPGSQAIKMLREYKRIVAELDMRF